MDKTRLRPIESRMLSILLDGELHRDTELHACLWDELGPMRNIEAHLTSLRKHLRPEGYSICLIRQQEVRYFRLVRTFTPGAWD